MKSKSLRKMFACFISFGIILLAGIASSTSVSAEGITVDDDILYAAYDESNIYFDYTTEVSATENLRNGTRTYTIGSDYAANWWFVSVSSRSDIECLTIPKKIVFVSEYTYEEKFTVDITKIGSFTDLEEVGQTNAGSNSDKFRSSVKKIIIQNNITEISETAFEGYENLEEISIAGSVTEIPDNAFKNLANLKKVSLGSGIASIGKNAFKGCSSLTEITIPDTVKSIGESAFEGCSALTEIDIPDGVTSIGNYAFRNCKLLSQANIPNSVTALGADTFYGCSALSGLEYPDNITKIYFQGYDVIKVPSENDESQNLFFVLKNKKLSFVGVEDKENISIKTLTIPDKIVYDNETLTVTNIERLYNFLAFGTEFSLNGFRETVENVIFPERLTSIGNYAFYNCYSLTEINIPDSVKTIGTGAFYNCSLSSAEIPDSVTSIGSWAFSYCSSLSSVEIPDSVKSIGGYAFFCCTSLSSIKIPDGLTSVPDMCFYECTALSSVEIPDSVTTIGYDAFEGCISLSSITIPNTVQLIEERAFKNTGLQHFEMSPESALKTLDTAVFANCKNLKSVYLPNITQTQDRAFQGCNSLEEVYIPSLTKVSAYMFKDCTSLKEFTVYPTITKISTYAFLHCSYLEKLTVAGSKLTYISPDAFNGCNNLTVYAKKGTYTADFAEQHNIPFVEIANLTNTSEVTVINEDNVLKARVQAGATGGFGEYKYEVYYKLSNENGWNLLQNYSENSEVSFRINYAQEYNVCVKVTDFDKAVSCKYITVNSAYPEQPVFANVSAISAQTVTLGEQLDIFADSVNGIDSKYAVYYKKTGSSKWTTVQKYGKNQNVSVVLPSVGEYAVCVKAKDIDGLISCKYFTVSVVKPDFENTSTVSAETIIKGETLTMNGSSTGGSGTCQYAFYSRMKNSNSWTQNQGYSYNTTVSFTPKYKGDYDICIKVKDSTGTIKKKYFTLKVIIFENTSSVSSTELTLGETLTMSGSVSDSTSDYKYSFWIRESDKNWQNIQAYSTKSTAVFTPTVTGTYEVCIKARDKSYYEEKQYFTVTVK